MFHSAGSLLTRAHPWLEGQRFSSQSEGPGFPHLVPRAGVTVNLVIGSCRASSFCVEGEPTVIAGTRCGQFQKNGAMRKSDHRCSRTGADEEHSEGCAASGVWRSVGFGAGPTEESLISRAQISTCLAQEKHCNPESGCNLEHRQTRVSYEAGTESQGKALQP